MSWREFSYLLSGLSPKTPLGNIASIRSEEDPEILKTFTPDQKRIRNEYRRKMAKGKSKQELNDALESFKQAFLSISGNNNEET